MGSRGFLKNPRGRIRRASAGNLSAFLAFDRGGELEPSREQPPARTPWTLKTTDTLRPGEPGTKRLAAEFGDRLVCVR